MKDRLGEMLLRENAIDPEQLEQARDFLRFTDEISTHGLRDFGDRTPGMTIRCQAHLDDLALTRHIAVIQAERRQVAPRFGIQRDPVTGIGMAGPRIFL